jgi:hypothetical protein
MKTNLNKQWDKVRSYDSGSIQLWSNNIYIGYFEIIQHGHGNKIVSC